MGRNKSNKLEIGSCWWCNGSKFHLATKCFPCNGTGKDRVRVQGQKLYNALNDLPINYNLQLD